MRFRTIVRLGGKTATGLPVPDDVVAALGSKRAAVVVTVNGYTYRTTTGSMGGEVLVPLSAEHRTKAGVAAGEEVEVDLALDDAPRPLAVPDDLRAAIRSDRGATATFDRLAPSHRKAYVTWVEEAKKAQTRASRVAEAVEMLRQGRTR